MRPRRPDPEHRDPLFSEDETLPVLVRRPDGLLARSDGGTEVVLVCDMMGATQVK